jgi:peptidoglycan/xylan/chitin deacetylase (PgdA/CDA1 family)
VWTTLAVSGLVAACPTLCRALANEAPGSTQVAGWKDDKKAAFLLMFDDGEPTHLATVIPELKKRGFIGTFYLNPNAKWFVPMKGRWEKEATEAGMVFGNHTMNHSGARNATEAEAEIAPANDCVLGLYPDRKRPRLLSFCRPGGSPWDVTPEDMQRLLKKYNLVQRPPPDGRFAGIHLKTAEALIQVVDGVLAKGGVDQLFFHGVGGDWLSQPKEDFVIVLDHLAANREKLWVTDPVSVHQYETERAGAAVKVIQAGATEIRLALSTSADPVFYDEPLTLLTHVSPDWKTCRIEQSGKSITVTAINGVVRYDAKPGGEVIVIRLLP